jgi:hypothetical protein
MHAFKCFSQEKVKTISNNLRIVDTQAQQKKDQETKHSSTSNLFGDANKK